MNNHYNDGKLNSSSYLIVQNFGVIAKTLANRVLAKKNVGEFTIAN